MHVVILNGPPGSGKDTLALHLTNFFNGNSKYLYFKEALYKESHKWLGTEAIAFDKFLEIAADEVEKEKPLFDIGIPFDVESNEKDKGKTMWSLRMILQHVSENIIKPKFGNNYFGIRALEEIATLEAHGKHKVVFFSDGGFVDEIDTVAEHYRTFVINLSRPGKSFEGDSRDYVYDSKAERHWPFCNDGTIDEAVYNLANIISRQVGLSDPRQ
tara:strand:+ start:847 stop:1488 length:642 start_codon:yes stop_codon:yes gene_type:complete